MAKKLKYKAVKPVEQDSELVCQHCSHHKNHPSMCKVTGKYVGRKAAACESYKDAK